MEYPDKLSDSQKLVFVKTMSEKMHYKLSTMTVGDIKNFWNNTDSNIRKLLLYVSLDKKFVTKLCHKHADSLKDLVRDVTIHDWNDSKYKDVFDLDEIFGKIAIQDCDLPYR